MDQLFQQMHSKQGKNNVNLDSFNTISVIGKGSYAKVVLVRKKDTQKIYAMKIVKKEQISKRRQQNNIMTERNILVENQNQFVVKMDYAFQNEKKLFFVLEYCAGGELYNLLQKKRVFSEDQAKFYVAQIVLALEYLHLNNIIYRDLKPENIIIDAQGYIKLTDFGLSKKNINDELLTYSICGTPEYLAPEILMQKGYGKSVDWWTLGCIIYEMVTGNPPFYSENNKMQLLEMIKSQNPEIPIQLSPQLQNLIEGLLQKDPMKRFGSQKGADEIKSHPWLSSFDFQRLVNRELMSPFVPKLKGETDLRNFDSEFTESQLTPNIFNFSNNSHQNQSILFFFYFKDFSNFDYNQSLQNDNNSYQNNQSINQIYMMSQHQN